ncbi:transient receptor potential cation channel subfamily A member 1 homolog [Patella vulgata]|uniref:transient receptor potential cation channel subfamily A member 1 homolog n=1 Tax=Patella vulgata TaxID=6465 RepID=UPI00217FB1D2|nr:transient receptor potential cation channel subfamily A member 1 homolog [Patella vulgata]
MSEDDGIVLDSYRTGTNPDFNTSNSGNMELSNLIDERGSVSDNKEGRGANGEGLRRSESAEIINLTLHQCARDGDEKNLKILIRHMQHHLKRKINQHDDDELSPLHYAARYNHLSVVKLLVENNADPNDRGEDGITPLHYAARYRRERKKKREASEEEEQSDENLEETGESVVTYLITKGASINATDIYGQTALSFAAMRGNEQAAQDLLSFRKSTHPNIREEINIEAQDLQGITALHLVAIHNQVEIARMLIESGANLRCCDKEQSTPLHHACSEGNIEIVKMLFEAGAKTPEGWVMISNMVTDTDIEQSTCLHLAVDNGHYDVCRLCLEKRADVNVPRKHYMHPLHLAAVSGEIRIVQLLVDNKARIDVLNDEQATPLHKAAQFNHCEVVKFLVDRKAKINCRDKDNYTPLLLAATYGRTECVELLLEKNADYTVVDKDDKTAIYLAAEENRLQTLRTLLSDSRMKELINTGDKYSNDPLHVAAKEGFLDIVKCLLENGADLDSKNEEEQTPVHLAARYGRTIIVKELVKHDKSVVYDEDEDSNTALHLAAMYGHDKVVEILIEFGSDVAARNYNQWTPLDLAASKGWSKTSKILLEQDAPIDPMDKSNTTPLHLASRAGHAQVVELLLDWDANVAQRDAEGNNSLDLAIEHHNMDVAFTIIASPVWEDALRNAALDLTTGILDTPMRRLIRKMPEVAEKVFDKCLSYGAEKNPERPNYEITFNYEFLDDAYAPWMDIKPDSSEYGSASDSVFEDENKVSDTARAYTSDSNLLKTNHPIMIMVSSNREDLLGHPLVTSLLNHKWKSFGRFIYYLLLFIFAIFLVFLTGYITTTVAPYQYKRTDADLIISNNCTNLTDKREKHTFAKIGKWVILGLAVFNLLKELLQIFQAKLSYLGWTNLIEWVTYVTALLLVIDFNECQDITGYRYDWQWSLGAVSIFLAWMDLVSFIQKFPRFGIYVVMLTDVLKTFAQFFIVFFLFIVAFALAFFTLFQNQIAFRSVGNSLMKTSVMMIGEFEFGDVFNTEVTSNDAADQVYMPEVSYLLFVVFMILMSIIIMNLLVGLAVDDIKAVQEQAILKRMAMQVELALDVERILPDVLKKKFYIKRNTIKPNMLFNNTVAKIFKVESSLSAHTIQKALNPELDDIEKVQEAQEKMQTDLKKIKKNMKSMREQNSRIESMLKALVTQSADINWQEEDFQDDNEQIVM